MRGVQYDSPIRALVAMEAMGWLAYAGTAVDNCFAVDRTFASVLDKRSGVDLAAQRTAPGRTASRLIVRSTVRFRHCELGGDSRHVFQPPGRTAPRPVPSVVQRASDVSQGVSALPQASDFIQALPVQRGQARRASRRRQADSRIGCCPLDRRWCACGSWSPACIRRSSRVPIGYGRHDVQNEAPCGRAGIE